MLLQNDRLVDLMHALERAGGTGDVQVIHSTAVNLVQDQRGSLLGPVFLEENL